MAFSLARNYIWSYLNINKTQCPIITERDRRLELDSEKFNGVMVYNIFSLEELNIRDFLRSSRSNDCNIILKAGATYCGFERAELIQFMSTKKVYLSTLGIDVYETPFNHCITAEAFNHLKYEDFTI